MSVLLSIARHDPIHLALFVLAGVGILFAIAFLIGCYREEAKYRTWQRKYGRFGGSL